MYNLRFSGKERFGGMSDVLGTVEDAERQTGEEVTRRQIASHRAQNEPRLRCPCTVHTHALAAITPEHVTRTFQTIGQSPVTVRPWIIPIGHFLSPISGTVDIRPTVMVYNVSIATTAT